MENKSKKLKDIKEKGKGKKDSIKKIIEAGMK